MPIAIKKDLTENFCSRYCSVRRSLFNASLYWRLRPEVGEMLSRQHDDERRSRSAGASRQRRSSSRGLTDGDRCRRRQMTHYPRVLTGWKSIGFGSQDTLGGRLCPHVLGHRQVFL